MTKPKEHGVLSHFRQASVAARAILLGAATLLGAAGPARSADAFRAFLDSLWPDAQALGVTRATFDAAFKGLTPDLTLPDLVIDGRKRDDSAPLRHEKGDQDEEQPE